MLLQAMPIRNWGEAFMTSLGNAVSMFLAAIPRILAFLTILIIGWIVARLLARGVAALLRAIRFNDLADRAGLSRFVQNMGVRTDSTGVMATVVKWFVGLVVLIVAFDALGLPVVSEVLREFLLWIPNLIVALFVLVIGGVAANALARLVRATTAQAGLERPDLFATITRFGVWGLAIVIAINQLGVATNLVTILFTGVIAALALALGLAFGLGGRETASDLLGRWRARAGGAGRAIGERAEEEAKRRTGREPTPRSRIGPADHPPGSSAG
jgi:hypothetical protein